MLGTGKYRNAEEMNAALEASGCEIVTVALRRIDLDAPRRSILDEIDWQRYHILPNTAGARTAEEAVRTARLARAMGLSDWIKVEVIPDPKYLLPDPVGTFEACRTLVDEGLYRSAVHQRRPRRWRGACRRSGPTPSCRWPRPSAAARA